MTQWRVVADPPESVLSRWFTCEPAARKALALALKWFPEARLELREQNASEGLLEASGDVLEKVE